MNRLRELIAEFAKRTAIAGWRERAIHRDNLEDYLMDNAAAIADLIDAAQMCVVTAGPGTITDITPLRAPLAKLEAK